MKDFKSYLIREKVKLGNLPDNVRAKLPDLDSIRSNRIDFEWEGANGLYKIVVRAQNTHVTMRFAAEVIRHLNRNSAGEVLKLSEEVWQGIWSRNLSTYEQEFNENLWGMLYINGEAVFKTHQKRIADILEKCAAAKRQDYEYNATFVEYVLKELGWQTKVIHENEIAGMIFKDRKMIKGSINPRRGIDNKVFSFKLTGEILDIDRVCAAFLLESIFLEAGNLNFLIDLWRPQVEGSVISPRDPKTKQMYRALQQLNILIREVRTIEGSYKVIYRPERPGFLK